MEILLLSIDIGCSVNFSAISAIRDFFHRKRYTCQLPSPTHIAGNTKSQLRRCGLVAADIDIIERL
jgi:hypothetical protein